MKIKIEFFADNNLINSVKRQLIEIGLMPTDKLVEKVIRDCIYFSGDAFIQQPTLCDRYDYDAINAFKRTYLNLGFKIYKF